ncbi:MAG: PD-(D/E)XK nuclease family protein, partial [Nanoarchaeota archaeon]|nr:PD-(D/E)XK nuclease family protein [Nanoarchaeota archaeon]
MTTFSHSKIGTYETCPLQYKYHYIDRVEVEQEDTVETFLGSWVHKALEKLYLDLQHQKLLSLKELIDFFNKEWKENWNPTIKINKKEYTSENYRKMGVKYLTDYYEHYKPFSGKVIGLETTDMLELSPDYKFHVRIDRLVDAGSGVYEIHDYKTGRHLATQEDVDKDRQLAMYSYWVKKNFKDLKKVKLVWHFLAFDKEMISSRTDVELEELKKEVIKKIKDIEKASEFPPNESALCSYCAYQGICPIWGHSLSLEKKSANEFLKDTGVKLVNEYVKTVKSFKIIEDEVNEKLSKLKEALIAYCKDKGVTVVV